jgi:hypothetical protein
MTRRLISVTGLILGLLCGGGMAIAAEPPTLTPDDISRIDISRFIVDSEYVEFTTSYSIGFTSTVTRMGDMFVHRFFAMEYRAGGKTSTSLDLMQIDCASKRSRVLTNRYIAFQGEILDTDTPSPWRNFVSGSVEDNSCQKAYADRALAATTN